MKVGEKVMEGRREAKEGGPRVRGDYRRSLLSGNTAAVWGKHKGASGEGSRGERDGEGCCREGGNGVLSRGRGSGRVFPSPPQGCLREGRLEGKQSITIRPELDTISMPRTKTYSK